MEYVSVAEVNEGITIEENDTAEVTGEESADNNRF